MEVICELMKLKPERVREYLDMHDNTPTELIRAIKECGFSEEYIYILDNLVIVIMKCEDFEKSRKKLSATAEFQRWTTKVLGMLTEDPRFFKTNDRIVDLKPVWNLDDFR